ncbi:hypothetical protein [Curtobacterium sp. NPDC092190]|uniref:hypothetical protein n=1 Tax=Curtobacterium sp. NPDC092190 TaxID=3363973 RepID=UPI0037F83DC6
MADGVTVGRKQNDVALELLNHINEKIKADVNPSALSELALAYRYLAGGAQPGSTIVKQ